MSKRNKVTLMLLGASLVMAACSNGSNNENSSSAPASGASASNTASQETKGKGPTDITYMDVAWGPAWNNDNPVLKHMEERTNTKLTMQWVPQQEYTSRLNVALATGSLPDLIQLRPALTTTQINGIEKGLFLDLTPYIKSADFAKNYPNLAKFSDSMWEQVAYKGKIYGIPAQTAPAMFDGIWIRQDWLEEAKLAVPTTVDELADVMIKLSKPPERYGLDFNGPWFGGNIAAAFTGINDWGFDESGNVVYNKFVPAYKDYLSWFRKLYEAKAIDPEFPLGQPASDFLSGKSVVSLFPWHARVPAENPHQKFKPEAGDAKTILIKAVKGPKGYSITENKQFQELTAISSKVPQEKVPGMLAFLDFLSSEEFENLEIFGIDGVHNSVVDGKKVTNDKFKDDQVDVVNWFSHENRDADWFIRDLTTRRGATPEGLSMVKDVVADSMQKLKDANYDSIQLHAISETFNSKWEQLTKDMADMQVKVVMGKATLKDWDDYVSGITSSDIYKQIQSEFKAGYSK